MPGLVGPAHPELKELRRVGGEAGLAPRLRVVRALIRDDGRPESPALHPSPNRCSGLKDSGSKELEEAPLKTHVATWGLSRL